MCATETLYNKPSATGACFIGGSIMIEKGLYYATDNFATMIRSVGGEWNDPKHRPMVCLIKANENDHLYWAIPMGKLNHHNKKQQDRLNFYLALPQDDIRSCNCHIGRTTAKSIFFVSDAVPITDKYIECAHTDASGQPYIIKNPNLIYELERKLSHILAAEESKKNLFRQHITDIKNFLLNELQTL